MIAKIQINETKLHLMAAKEVAKEDAKALQSASKKLKEAETALSKAQEKHAKLTTPGAYGTRTKTPEQVQQMQADARQAIKEKRKAFADARAEKAKAGQRARASQKAFEAKDKAIDAQMAAKKELTHTRKEAESIRRKRGEKAIIEQAEQAKIARGLPEDSKLAARPADEPSLSQKEATQPSKARAPAPADPAHVSTGTGAPQRAVQAEKALAKEAGGAITDLQRGLGTRGSTGAGAITDPERGLGTRKTGTVAAQEAPPVRSGGALSKAMKTAEVVEKKLPKGRLRSIGRFMLRGGRVIKGVGRTLFTVFEAVNPIFDILLVLELGVAAMDYLVAWMDRQRIRDREEWRRIATFLSSPTEGVNMPPYNAVYVTGLGAAIIETTKSVLTGVRGNRDNFLTWINKWINEPRWSGFVYATIVITLERQHVTNDTKDPFEYTYWWLTSTYQLTLSDTPPPNRKTEQPLGIEGPGGPRNRRTGERQESVADPEYNLPVEIAQLDIVYTYSAPTLTPFDYLIAMCNDLISEIIAFVSRYDPTVYAEMESRTEYAGFKLDLFEHYNAPEPLYGPNISWCLSMIHIQIDKLQEHIPQPGDVKAGMSAKLTKGYGRRLRLLAELAGVGRKAPFEEIAPRLANLLTDRDPRLLLHPIDQELAYLDEEYLRDYAKAIHGDIQRAFKACQNETTRHEYNYAGRATPGG